MFLFIYIAIHHPNNFRFSHCKNPSSSGMDSPFNGTWGSLPANRQRDSPILVKRIENQNRVHFLVLSALEIIIKKIQTMAKTK